MSAPPNRIRLGVATGFGDVGRYVEWARHAEQLGYDLVGYGDSQCLLPDIHVALAATAAATQRTLVASTVTNPVTRHPAVVASAFGALQQLAGGRVRYCVGTGDSAVASLGERPATVDGMRAHLVAVRDLLAGRETTWHGTDVRLEWEAPPVPLWVAAEGPRMLALAGATADGVLMGNGLTEDVVRDNLRRVAAAAEAAGRDPADVEPWFFAKIVLCDDEEQAWTDLAWTLAATANHAFAHGLDHKFVPSDLRSAIGRLLDGYVTEEHNGLVHEPVRNAALVVEHGLTEFLGRRFLIAGPPSRVRERIDELASWGATNLITAAIFGDPFAYVDEVAAQVLVPLG